MVDLILPVKRYYFEQIKSGTKVHEYRLFNSYWQKRLLAKPYSRVVITLGYPRSDDSERRLIFPWNGYVIVNHKHEHFGENEVKVFAIKLSKGN